MALGELVLDLSVAIQKFKQDVTDAKDSVQSMTESTGKFIKDNSAEFEKAGAIVAGFGATITAAFTGAVMSGAEFDAAMSQVQAVTLATAEEMDEMSAIALQLGIDTAFSSQQAAEGMGILGQAGFDTGQIIDALPGVLDLAAAGAIALGTAADITAATMGGFGLEAENAAHIADVLAAASTGANTTIEAMGGAFSMVAPLANAAGVSMEETGAAIMVMANAGIDGTRAGTNLGAMFTQILSPTDQAKEKMMELGLELTNLDGTLIPLPDLVDQLANSGMTAGEAMEIFGQQGGRAALVLAETGVPAIEGFTESLIKSDGAASDMADTLLDNLSGAVTLLGSSVDTLGISLTQGFQEPLQDVVEAITAVLNEITAWILENEELATVLAAITAALGVTATAVGGLVLVLPTLVAGIEALLVVGGLLVGILSGPVGIVVALGLAVTAIVAFTDVTWANIDAFVAYAGPIGTAISLVDDLVVAAWNAVEGHFEQAKALEEATARSENMASESAELGTVIDENSGIFATQTAIIDGVKTELGNASTETENLTSKQISLKDATNDLNTITANTIQEFNDLGFGLEDTTAKITLMDGTVVEVVTELGLLNQELDLAFGKITEQETAVDGLTGAYQEVRSDAEIYRDAIMTLASEQVKLTDEVTKMEQEITKMKDKTNLTTAEMILLQQAEEELKAKKEELKEVTGALTEATGEYGDMAGVTSSNWAAAASDMVSSWLGLKTSATGDMDAMQTHAGNVFPVIGNMFRSFFTDSAVVDSTYMKGQVTGDMGGIQTDAGNFFATIGNWFRSMYTDTAVVDSVYMKGQVTGDMGTLQSTALSVFMAMGQSGATEFFNPTSSKFLDLGTLAGGVWDTIKSSFANSLISMAQDGNFNNLKQKFLQLGDLARGAINILSKASSLGSSVTGFLTHLGAEVGSAGTAIASAASAAGGQIGAGIASAGLTLETLGLSAIPLAITGLVEWLGGVDFEELRRQEDEYEQVTEAQNLLQGARGVVSGAYSIIRKQHEEGTLTGAEATAQISNAATRLTNEYSSPIGIYGQFGETVAEWENNVLQAIMDSINNGTALPFASPGFLMRPFRGMISAAEREPELITPVSRIGDVIKKSLEDAGLFSEKFGGGRKIEIKNTIQAINTDQIEDGLERWVRRVLIPILRRESELGVEIIASTGVRQI